MQSRNFHPLTVQVPDLMLITFADGAVVSFGARRGAGVCGRWSHSRGGAVFGNLYRTRLNFTLNYF